jgi:hypothetical protein
LSLVAEIKAVSQDLANPKLNANQTEDGMEISILEHETLVKSLKMRLSFN